MIRERNEYKEVAFCLIYSVMYIKEEKPELINKFRMSIYMDKIAI